MKFRGLRGDDGLPSPALSLVFATADAPGQIQVRPTTTTFIDTVDDAWRAVKTEYAIVLSKTLFLGI